MSTNDVPGANPKNRDELACGCWAEHEDGSLIFVESTEDDRVIYSVFDMEKDPVTEYRDSMKIGAFKKAFTWNPSDKALLSGIKWTWHDKTPFPWDRVIKKGAKDGIRHVHVEDQLNAAERVRQSRESKKEKVTLPRPVDEREIEAKVDRLGSKAKKIMKKLQRALEELGA
jgi:hypothetical protein